MTDKKANKTLDLTAAERVGLERVASTEAPHNQRAQALLAVAEGMDLAGAGDAAGLSTNQVRHWLGRFGTGRLSIFPEELLAAADTGEEAEEELTLLDVLDETLLLDAPDEAPMLDAPHIAAELSAFIDNPEAVAAALEGTAVAEALAASSSKKKKNKKAKESKDKKKKKSGKKKDKDKKDKKNKKSKKSKKSKKKK